jgi:hypothetical protein
VLNIAGPTGWANGPEKKKSKKNTKQQQQQQLKSLPSWVFTPAWHHG